jgi:hypothetical protein
MVVGFLMTVESRIDHFNGLGRRWDSLEHESSHLLQIHWNNRLLLLLLLLFLLAKATVECKGTNRALNEWGLTVIRLDILVVTS